jgi:hypothetical protein
MPLFPLFQEIKELRELFFRHDLVPIPGLVFVSQHVLVRPRKVGVILTHCATPRRENSQYG